MTFLYGLSFALHASLGAGVAEIEPAKEPERIAITVVDVPKAKPKPTMEPPPPPLPARAEAPKPKSTPSPRAKAPRKQAAEPPPTAAPAPPADAPSFGVAMTGGVSAGGVAVPAGDSLQGAPEPTRRVAQAKTLLEPQQAAEGACAEPATKPRPVQLARPAYTDEARAARVEGKVRLELTVDAHGAVKSVRVLETLGHGLDEAAVRAVQAATFEPAQACGKAVAATFVVSLRFAL